MSAAIPLLALLPAAIWILHSVRSARRAFAQRQLLLSAILAQANWRPLYRDFQRVSFDDHLNAILWRRRPAALYSGRIRAATERAR